MGCSGKYLYLLTEHDQREPASAVCQLLLRLPGPEHLQNEQNRRRVNETLSAFSAVLQGTNQQMAKYRLML